MGPALIIIQNGTATDISPPVVREIPRFVKRKLLGKVLSCDAVIGTVQRPAIQGLHLIHAVVSIILAVAFLSKLDFQISLTLATNASIFLQILLVLIGFVKRFFAAILPISCFFSEIRV